MVRKFVYVKYLENDVLQTFFSSISIEKIFITVKNNN